MVNNFDCLMSEKTMQRICFVYTKIRCATLAAKIFKNIGILFKTISTYAKRSFERSEIRTL